MPIRATRMRRRNAQNNVTSPIDFANDFNKLKINYGEYGKLIDFSKQNIDVKTVIDKIDSLYTQINRNISIIEKREIDIQKYESAIKDIEEKIKSSSKNNNETQIDNLKSTIRTKKGLMNELIKEVDKLNFKNQQKENDIEILTSKAKSIMNLSIKIDSLKETMKTSNITPDIIFKLQNSQNELDKLLSSLKESEQEPSPLMTRKSQRPQPRRKKTRGNIFRKARNNTSHLLGTIGEDVSEVVGDAFGAAENAFMFGKRKTTEFRNKALKHAASSLSSIAKITSEHRGSTAYVAPHQRRHTHEGLLLPRQKPIPRGRKVSEEPATQTVSL
jgi:hypothetical protein